MLFFLSFQEQTGWMDVSFKAAVCKNGQNLPQREFFLFSVCLTLDDESAVQQAGFQRNAAE